MSHDQRGAAYQVFVRWVTAAAQAQWSAPHVL